MKRTLTRVLGLLLAAGAVFAGGGTEEVYPSREKVAEYRPWGMPASL